MLPTAFKPFQTLLFTGYMGNMGDDVILILSILTVFLPLIYDSYDRFMVIHSCAESKRRNIEIFEFVIQYLSETEFKNFCTARYFLIEFRLQSQRKSRIELL